MSILRNWAVKNNFGRVYIEDTGIHKTFVENSLLNRQEYIVFEMDRSLYFFGDKLGNEDLLVHVVGPKKVLVYNDLYKNYTYFYVYAEEFTAISMVDTENGLAFLVAQHSKRKGIWETYDVGYNDRFIDYIEKIGSLDDLQTVVKNQIEKNKKLLFSHPFTYYKSFPDFEGKIDDMFIDDYEEE